MSGWVGEGFTIDDPGYDPLASIDAFMAGLWANHHVTPPTFIWWPLPLWKMPNPQSRRRIRRARHRKQFRMKGKRW